MYSEPSLAGEPRKTSRPIGGIHRENQRVSLHDVSCQSQFTLCAGKTFCNRNRRVQFKIKPNRFALIFLLGGIKLERVPAISERM
jgi:hypothetical protein